MKMPSSDITVHDIAGLVGGYDVHVDVIDVELQSEITDWTMRHWADYFDTHPDKRNRILNVISLEISGTKLAKQIKRPRIVRELDWIDLMWPRDQKDVGIPKVQLYCLMGTKGSYTDFHIDFGGSSVFYHIVSGAKTFYLIKPTVENLEQYRIWSLSDDYSTFFGDKVDKCYIVKLKAGDTLFIPSGWIHAVYTPEDSIVFGGNFLQSFNIQMQLKVDAIEEITGIPPKFRFPYFMRLNWYALVKFESWLSLRGYHNITFSNFELESMAVLAFYWKSIMLEDRHARLNKPISHYQIRLWRNKYDIPNIVKNPFSLVDRVLMLSMGILVNSQYYNPTKGSTFNNFLSKRTPTTPTKHKTLFIRLKATQDNTLLSNRDQ
ncbi:uncharacterized protein BX663DRAFT_62169 [Cokeromyces recurvatus]|uniref:uncharacterized protein n=1 Tax=Cokeromyces recurvatus TaxID=90255 RepID=UPI00221F945A|nr:uncharacterized protein BX663DRAFT_62169 [Cokeromyces recurvatus]KAI7902568.1 hypothetical protein BX663DRAFT_62169 [Cokeromyces recurvatus]